MPAKTKVIEAGDLLVTRKAPLTYCRKHKCEHVTFGIGDEGSCSTLWSYLCLICLHDQVMKAKRGQIVLAKNAQIVEDSG